MNVQVSSIFILLHEHRANRLADIEITTCLILAVDSDFRTTVSTFFFLKKKEIALTTSNLADKVNSKQRLMVIYLDLSNMKVKQYIAKI